MRRALRAGAAASVALVAVVAAGCAVPPQHSPVVMQDLHLPREVASRRSASSSTTPVALYFVSHDRLRATSAPGGPLSVGDIVRQLLGGPTSAEAAAGLSTAIPLGTTLDHWRVTGGVADLDFDAVLASVSGQEQTDAFGQIVTTATSLPGVERVQISIDGATVNAPTANGSLAQGPVGRSAYTALLPRAGRGP